MPFKFRSLSGFLRDRLYCPVCNTNPPKFMPLPSSYAMNAKQYGYKHFGKGETINLEEYSCSNCGASDRERLCALFFNETLGASSHNQQLKLLHFAPEHALSTFLREFGLAIYRTADLNDVGADDQIDIMKMHGYQDDEWDAFVCSHVCWNMSKMMRWP